MPGRERGAQRLAQVGDVVLVDIEVGVAGDAELRERLHLATWKELGQVGADHAGQQHEGLAPGRERIGQPDHAGQHPRHLDDGDRVVAAVGIAPAELDDEIQRLVGDLRKGMGQVQPDRHQQRANLLLEELVDPASLGHIALCVVQHHDALGLEGRHHDLVEGGVLLVDHHMGMGGHIGHLGQRDARARHARGLEVIGKAHLEELVHVGRDDGDVAQALQQRHVLPQRLGQNAAVEFEDGLLAVEQGGHRHGRGGNGHAFSL